MVAGLTVLVSPVDPSFHTTVPEQLETVNTVDCPAQIDGLLTVGVGAGVTVTVLVVEPEQAPTAHVAEYVVVVVGLTVRVAPVIPPPQLTVPEQFDTVSNAD
ncbi:hypothetical protein GCM10028807_00320 [Spirosoma daeguense]